MNNGLNGADAKYFATNKHYIFALTWVGGVFRVKLSDRVVEIKPTIVRLKSERFKRPSLIFILNNEF